MTFKKELNIIRSLSHNNIMNFDCIYETDDCFYLVFEPVLEINLEDLIQMHKKISKKKTKIIMRALFNALFYLHSKNIIHRDIHPQNIFFRKKKIDSQNIVLGNFGLSIQQDHKFYLKCGTPGFIAPELLNIKKKNVYDKKCDLFSLGITFYCIRLGTTPYEVGKLVDIVEKNKNCEFKFSKNYTALNYKGTNH